MTTPSTPAGTAETHAEIRRIAALTDEVEFYDAIEDALNTDIDPARSLRSEIAALLASHDALLAENERLTAAFAGFEQIVKTSAEIADKVVAGERTAREQAEQTIEKVRAYLSVDGVTALTRVSWALSIISALSPAAAASPHPTAERNEG